MLGLRLLIAAANWPLVSVISNTSKHIHLLIFSFFFSVPLLVWFCVVGAYYKRYVYCFSHCFSNM